ncbi:TerB family tellurite resistance protein [Hymenobacter busanensis]|uniref:TerB family tellurite resistance protein n=1 Tax=Hymenobacter busanensis TaxID=2607656 RepID=A0A7L4ZZI3_9BACT|nr:TerB family tellurite resistance protein [Hymenobacter busanensis]KAA9331296.1 TerB family tellurite resistance protein [Hymenobacter busanensis]QHJ08447.1 TerB family tellurite resistance protein [Hymenobacter busanensis]
MANEQQVLQQYSEAEKTAYLSVIASIASADREASAPEVEFLQQLAQTAGLSPQGTQQVVTAAQDSTNESIKANLDQLRNSQLRFSLVKDLISFARADGAYANNEEQMVNKISAYLGVNQEQVQTLEQVADQQAAQPEEAHQEGGGLFSGISDKLNQVGIPPQAAMTGLLTVLAPMVLSRVMGGGRSAGLGGMMGGGGGLGGLLGGMMGGGGGGLGGLLGGMAGGGNPHGGMSRMGGGLGTIMSVLGGLGGNPQMGARTAGGGGLGGLMNGGLGGMLGGLLGGR